MSKLLPVIVILIAAIAGGGGGYFFKLQQAGAAKGEEHAASGSDHEIEADAHSGKKKKKKSGHGGEEESDTVYMKFGRQFVVPVVESGRPRSMMIMDINIEVDSELGETVYAYEPRLRDAILSHLIMKAGQGDLPQVLEDTAMMDQIKGEILGISREIIGDGALEVLIQDIGIQSY